MKRPWHFWFLFSLCVALILAALGWLTQKALELDRAEALARRRAEQEQNISRALWRMDVQMMPLLAREAARPYFIYPATGDPQQQSAQAKLGAEEPSPLLLQCPQHVLLNFQLEANQRWTSPQTPLGQQRELAVQQGVPPETIERFDRRLKELQQQVPYQQLLACLPTDTLPQPDEAQPGSMAAPVGKSGKVIGNVLDLDALEQQAGAPSSGVSGQAAEQLEQSEVQTQRDLRSRNTAVQTYAETEFVKQRLGWSETEIDSVREGVSQPVWIGSQLLLARRVEAQGEILIQGAWLDWPGIRQKLLGEIADLVPGAELVPVRDVAQIQVSRMLATLPVELMVPPAQVQPAGWSAIRISLVTAWGCVLLAVTAVGVLSYGALALSERRGAFVSAVTHELRTPLTTFRMYSEMLARNMVPGQQKRQEYLDTLRVEADRLTHLVENVLAYARLERSHHRGQREQVSIASLLDRCGNRLEDRALQAGMKLVVEADQATRSATFETDPAAVEQILFNLVDNSCKYARGAADQRIHLQISDQEGWILMRVRDHGSGISPRDARRLFCPFSKSAAEAARSAPGVGLGLALCRRLARELGGHLEFEPDIRDGAAFVLKIPSPGRQRGQRR